jgi:hypothetical protein
LPLNGKIRLPSMAAMAVSSLKVKTYLFNLSGDFTVPAAIYPLLVFSPFIILGLLVIFSGKPNS